MKTQPLRTFVRRTLLLRVALAGLVLCALAGAVAFLTERSRLQDAIVDAARGGAARLAGFAMARLEAAPEAPLPALREAVARAAESPVQLEAGRFVRLEIHDRAGAVLAEASQPGAADAAATTAVLAREPRAFPAAGELGARTVDAGPGWHLLVTVPLVGRQGQVAAWGRAVFEASPEAQARARRAALRAALLAALVVLAVAGLLYPVVLGLADRLADHATALLDANLETLAVLGSAIAKRDSDTDAHNYRVTLYAARLGEAAGLDAATRRALVKGAFLHDVGKIGIPDAILLKPGKLDDREFGEMKTHVGQGVEIVSRSAWLGEAVRVVGSHHEKYRGEGYPAGVAASDIPVEARVFAIVDVFDALTSERPYKQPFPLEKALAILEADRGTHFDPALLDRFRELAPELHRRYAGQGREGLQAELDEALRALFSPQAGELELG